MWDAEDASIACRQLGFSAGGTLKCLLRGHLVPVHLVTGSQAFGGAIFGQGSGPIHLDDVSCNGREQRLLDSQARPMGNNCEHHEDAGVRCSPSK
jgi:hypothetical protein